MKSFFIFTYINYYKRKRILEKLAAKDDFFFVQIGANDGISNDPIRKYILKYKWRGILVEPIPETFELLKQNYSDQEQLIFERLVISDTKGKVDFYKSPRSVLSSLHDDSWFKENNSFGYLNRKIAGGAEKIQVDSMPLMELLHKHNVGHLDLLQIDTEGFDAEIIEMLDFTEIKPVLIAYEDHHYAQDVRDRLRALLQSHGYSLLNVGPDKLAYLADRVK